MIFNFTYDDDTTNIDYPSILRYLIMRSNSQQIAFNFIRDIDYYGVCSTLRLISSMESNLLYCENDNHRGMICFPVNNIMNVQYADDVMLTWPWICFEDNLRYFDKNISEYAFLKYICHMLFSIVKTYSIISCDTSIYVLNGCGRKSMFLDKGDTIEKTLIDMDINYECKN